MKKITLAFLLILAACSSKTQLPNEVTKVIDDKKIEISKYPWAVEALSEHVANCGPGVVVDAAGENRCGYTVAVDDLLIQNPLLGTGMIEDPTWYEKTGVEWFEPSDEDIRDTPITWSFLDMGRAAEVKINRQLCGDCWSQATTKALELMIAGYDLKLIELSVQTQISKCSNHGSCGGGYMSAPDFLVKYGNPFEHQDPYQGKNSSCKFDMQKDPPFEYRLESAPYVGNSLNYSRFFKGDVRAPSAAQTRAAMVKMKSPAVVTIAAINHSSGIIDSCSAVGSGGNHMQDIVAFYPHPSTAKTVADVWNSWGTSHGKNGRTQIVWECGNGLNRGLGVSARVYVYKPDCKNQPAPVTGPNQDFLAGTFVRIGAKSDKQQCKWTPAHGLTDPNACETFASPKVTTEYHLEATTECGKRTAMVLIRPLGPVGPASRIDDRSELILTPHGMVQLER